MCKRFINFSITVNATTGSPHDLRKDDPEFFGWLEFRMALETAESGFTKEPRLLQEGGWNRAYKKGSMYLNLEWKS